MNDPDDGAVNVPAWNAALPLIVTAVAVRAMEETVVPVLVTEMVVASRR